MKNALFALAALLLLIGGICVITGSLSIDTERGLTGVICGTSAIVGSAVIVALAWMNRTLEQIHATLQAGDATAAVAALAPKQDALRRERAAAAAIEDAATAPLAWPPHSSPLPPAVPTNVEAEEAAAEVIAEQDRREIFAAEAQEIASAPLEERPVPEPAKAQSSFKDMWRRVGKETQVKETEAKPPRPVAPPPIPVPMEKPPRPMFGAKPAPSASTPTTPTPTTSAPPAPPPSSPAVSAPGAMPPPPPPMHEVEFTAEQNDWLDHALAELDSAIAETPFARHAESEPAAPAAPVPPPAPGFPRRAEAEKPPVNKAPAEEKQAEAATPPHAQETEPATDLASLAQEPAVIGRYEAEGTTYIMFADGSIEAQSERGVARFKSMADLKAYFETQEAP